MTSEQIKQLQHDGMNKDGVFIFTLLKEATIQLAILNELLSRVAERFGVK